MQLKDAFMRMEEDEMLEIKSNNIVEGPKIVVIGVGGGGNNALDRMIDSNLTGVNYVALNTDVQVLNECKAEHKIQIGKKLTKGYGAGTKPEIGEAAAMENEEEIKNSINDADMCIITCGMGGGTGTGAAPVVAKCCKEKGILTIAVVTTPFSFEGTPRIMASKSGIEKVEANVDTLFVIPNDKLIGLSEKPLLLETAFEMADSILRYVIEGITNIVRNKGVVNLDFNDLRTTFINKGVGHLGIGTADADVSVVEAVKQAINSPLLETSIEGAENLLINTSGKVNIVELNEAVNYVRELAGNKVNIIWGTVSGDGDDKEKVVVTLIATGMPNAAKIAESELNMNRFRQSAQKEEVDIVIPTFLRDAGKKITRR